jgi:hypothetical protein
VINLVNPVEVIAAKMQERSAAVYAAMQDGLVKGLRRFETTIVKEQFSGRPGLKTGHGAAKQSWFITVKGVGENVSAVLANKPNAWYISVHEHRNFDGNVTPKTSQFLTVPLNPAAQRMREDNKSLRDVGNLVFIKTYKSKGSYDYYLVQFNSRRIIPMFKLVRRVFIPKRLHIVSDFGNRAGNMLRAEIYKAVDKAITAGRVR